MCEPGKELKQSELKVSFTESEKDNDHRLKLILPEMQEQREKPSCSLPMFTFNQLGFLGLGELPSPSLQKLLVHAQK